MLSLRLSIPPQRRGVTAGPTVDRGVTDTAMGSSFGWISWWWNRLLIGIPWDTSVQGKLIHTWHESDVNRSVERFRRDVLFWWCGLNLDIRDKKPTARPPSSYPVTAPGYEEVIDSLAKQRKAQSIAMNMALCTSHWVIGDKEGSFFLLRKLIYQIPGNWVGGVFST